MRNRTSNQHLSFRGQTHDDAAARDTLRNGLVTIALLPVLLLTGCQGKTLVADNPVFSDLPPRLSLINRATKETTETAAAEPRQGDIQRVSLSSASEPLQGNTVVAEINGRPLFVDDLIGSVRVTLEADGNYTDAQRQQIMMEQLKMRLDQRVDEEIVLDVLETKVPEEQRDALKDHIEQAFLQFLETRKSDLLAEGKINSADELEAFLAQGGLSVGLLRETFFRIQMVNGYVQSLTEEAQGGAPNRRALLQYYRDHIDEFTPQERVRWQEIRISVSDSGGQTQAKQKMLEVIQQLKTGKHEFGDIARRYSDSLTAEESGNRGWLTRGALRDKELEHALFALPGGGLTSIFESDDYISIYRVARHEYAKARSFPAVQSEIEQAMQQEQMTAARDKVMRELRDAASVRTIFDTPTEL